MFPFLKDLEKPDQEVAVSVTKVAIPSLFLVTCWGIGFAFEMGVCQYFEIPFWLIQLESWWVAEYCVFTLVVGALAIFFFRELGKVFEGMHDAYGKLAREFLAVFFCGTILAFTFVDTGLLLLLSLQILQVGSLTKVVIDDSHWIKKNRGLISVGVIVCWTAAVIFASKMGIVEVAALIGVTVATSVLVLVVHKVTPANWVGDGEQTGQETTLSAPLASAFKVSILIGFLWVLAFLGGRKYASESKRFLQADKYADFVLVRAYGSSLILKEVCEEDSGTTFKERIQIIDNSSLGKSIWKYVEVGERAN